MAEQLGTNPCYLSELFKRYEGMAFSEFVLREKIDLAKNLLLYSNASFSEIDHICKMCLCSLQQSLNFHQIFQFLDLHNVSVTEGKGQLRMNPAANCRPADQSDDRDAIVSVGRKLYYGIVFAPGEAYLAGPVELSAPMPLRRELRPVLHKNQPGCLFKTHIQKNQSEISFVHLTIFMQKMC